MHKSKQKIKKYGFKRTNEKIYLKRINSNKNQQIIKSTAKLFKLNKPKYKNIQIL